jgi:type IX secretion system PorP/SprF family membrane protein
MAQKKKYKHGSIHTFVVFAGLAMSQGLFAQDIHFSQYFSAPLILNPALTGQFEGDFRFTTNYKTQWSAVSKNGFKTFAAAVDAPVYEKKVFAGLSFYNDKAGDSKMGTNTVNLSLSSMINFDENNSLVAGIQGGWAQRKLDLSGVTWDNQYDGNTFNNTLPSGEVITAGNFNYFDLSSGLYFHSVPSKTVKINAGVAAFHMNRPKQSFFGSGDRLYTKWTAHGNVEIKPSSTKNYTYIPSFMYLKQGPANELDLGMIVKYSLGMDSKYTGLNVSSNVYFGAFYRLKDAAIVYFRYEHKNILSVGVSYDINLSKLQTVSHYRGGAELSLIYTMWKPKKSLPAFN